MKHRLHTHPQMERRLAVPQGHVIIDAAEYQKAVERQRLALPRDEGDLADEAHEREEES